MKKKVLVIMPSMFLGGAERSVLGLLDALKNDNLEISFFSFRHEGELFSHIPKHINILPEMYEYTTFDRPIVELLKSKLFFYGLMRLWSKVILNIKCIIFKEEKSVWKSMQYTSFYLSKILPNIPGTYDLAISFQGVPFYMKKVDAIKKMAWIHTDYNILYPDKKMDEKAFLLVNYIVTVSEECKKSFDYFYPQLRNKSIVIENIISKSYVMNGARKENLTFFNEDNINFLSVGRFSDAKNFDNIPEICSYIVNDGFQIKWYLIGYGGEEKLIKEKITEYDMQDRVIILGKKDNPYPYIKACDYYIQPSRYEGKAVTVREAQILNKPVIITDFKTSRSQLIDGYDGIIVPLDNKKCADGIIKLLNDEQLTRKLIANTKQSDYTNKSEIDKIYKILEEC